MISNTREQSHAKPEKIYSISPASWWEDAWNRITISPDGRKAIYNRPWKGSGLVQTNTLQELEQKHAGQIEKVLRAVFRTGHELVLLGAHNSQKNWFVEGKNGLEKLSLSPDIIPSWSQDGHFLAYQKQEGASSQLYMGTIEKQEPFTLEGQINGISWSPDNRLVYATTWQPNGESSLMSVEPGTGKIETIVKGLDAAPWFNTIGIGADGNHLYLALASERTPQNEARHQPNAPRNLASMRSIDAQVIAAPKLPQEQTTSRRQSSMTTSTGTETKSTTRSWRFPLREGNPDKFRTTLPCLAGVLTKNRSASYMARGALPIGP